MTPAERYARDPHFRALVDVLENHIRQCNYTPTELREAVILAAIRERETRTRVVYGPARPDLMGSRWPAMGVKVEG